MRGLFVGLIFQHISDAPGKQVFYTTNYSPGCIVEGILKTLPGDFA
jgi:hypothetical protein